MPTNYEWLLHMDGEERQAWFDAEHVDARFHGATRMTNLERLFVDSEQFRQAVSAFAFAHSDECPTSPTQMVDWLMAPYVDAHSKPHSKTEQMLTEQSESLSDDLGHPTDMSQKSADCVRNDGKMSETGVSANDVDANDENATQDSREKLEADISKWCLSHAYGDTGYTFIIKQLNRQAEITRKTEQAAWIQQANGLIHEANVRADELRDELAKRDKGIARLKRQRDEARQQISILEAECDDCVYKQEWQTMDRLETERDALAHDLQDCERQRERLRQALGCAIDHAHEVVSLVNLDVEVIG